MARRLKENHRYLIKDLTLYQPILEEVIVNEVSRKAYKFTPANNSRYPYWVTRDRFDENYEVLESLGETPFRTFVFDVVPDQKQFFEGTNPGLSLSDLSSEVLSGSV